MRKSEYTKIYQEVAKEKGLEVTQKDVDVIIESLEEMIVRIFKAGESANIGGFLKVEPKERDAQERKCTLPGKEGEIMKIPAATIPGVKFIKSFKDEHTIIK